MGVEQQAKMPGLLRRRRAASPGGQGVTTQGVIVCQVSAADGDGTSDLRFASLFRWYGTTP
jgi:hypothetical protein